MRVLDDFDGPRAARLQRPLCLFGHTHVQIGYAPPAISSR
jgi:hypothetical protein